MKLPAWWVLCACAAVAVAATVVLNWQTKPRETTQTAGDSGGAGVEGLPWQIAVQPDGTSRAMGLHMGADTLAQVRGRTGDNLQVALVARLGEAGALEALADPFNAGFISGRLVLSFDVPASTLQRWRKGTTGSAPMEGGVRRFTLRAEDMAEADRSPLAGMSFVSTARLTEADIRQRFGQPDAQRALADGVVSMLYPALGVTATVASGQRAVIQYVAPRDAARLGMQAENSRAPDTHAARP